MKKNNLLVNIIFYIMLIFLVVRGLISLLPNLNNLPVYKIIVYILLISIYILLGYMYYIRNIKKKNKKDN